MNSDQQNHLSMYQAVRDFSTPNAAITATLPNYTTNFNTFQAIIPQIQSAAEQQAIDKSGITDSKKALRVSLVTIAADNARKLTTYATFTNNLTLLKEINFTESDFRNSADNDLKNNAQIVYDFIQPIVATLATYGITAATQTAFLAAINAYNAALASPRVGKVVSTQATGQLVTLFENAEIALGNMDMAIEIIKLPQPVFYEGYQHARKLIDKSAGTLALKVKVVNAQTGEPEANVVLTMIPATPLLKTAASNGKDKIVKKTAKGGGANVKNLPDGTYTYIASKPGFKDLPGTVTIVNGELTVLNIKLDKA